MRNLGSGKRNNLTRSTLPMGGNQGDLPEIEQTGSSAKSLLFTLFRNNLRAPELRDRGPQSSGLNTVTSSIANLALCVPGLQRDSKRLFCCFSCLLPPFSLPAWKLSTLSSWEIFSVSLKIQPRAYLFLEALAEEPWWTKFPDLGYLGISCLQLHSLAIDVFVCGSLPGPEHKHQASFHQFLSI